MNHDERMVWVKAAPSRRLVQTIDPAPCGVAVEIAYFESDIKVRQDVVIIADGMAAQGVAGKVS